MTPPKQTKLEMYMECSSPSHYIFSKIQSACFYDFIDGRVGCQSHCPSIQSPPFWTQIKRMADGAKLCEIFSLYGTLSLFHSHPLWQTSPAAVLAMATEPIKYRELMSFQNFPVRALTTGFVLTYLSLKFMTEPPSFHHQSPWECSRLEGGVYFFLSCKLVHRLWGYFLNHWGQKMGTQANEERREQAIPNEGFIFQTQQQQNTNKLFIRFVRSGKQEYSSLCYFHLFCIVPFLFSFWQSFWTLPHVCYLE